MFVRQSGPGQRTRCRCAAGSGCSGSSQRGSAGSVSSKRTPPHRQPPLIDGSVTVPILPAGTLRQAVVTGAIKVERPPGSGGSSNPPRAWACRSSYLRGARMTQTASRSPTSSSRPTGASDPGPHACGRSAAAARRRGRGGNRDLAPPEAREGAGGADPQRACASCSTLPTATRSRSATAAPLRSGTPPRPASCASARCTWPTGSSPRSSRRSRRRAVPSRPARARGASRATRPTSPVSSTAIAASTCSPGPTTRPPPA